MKQNTQNRTYITGEYIDITIRIHHYNIKYIIYKIKQKRTEHATVYAVIKKEQKNMV